MDFETFAQMPREEGLAWILAEQAKRRREREAECDANRRHMLIEYDTAFCGHCDRPYEEGPGI